MWFCLCISGYNTHKKFPPYISSMREIFALQKYNYYYFLAPFGATGNNAKNLLHYHMQEVFNYAILSRISFGKTALHLKSCILRQMRGTDAQQYLCVFQAAVTMQMTKI